MRWKRIWGVNDNGKNNKNDLLKKKLFKTLLTFVQSPIQMETEEIKRRQRLGKGAMKELRKTTKSKDVSLESKAKIIHTFVFLSLGMGVKVGQWRRLIGKI